MVLERDVLWDISEEKDNGGSITIVLMAISNRKQDTRWEDITFTKMFHVQVLFSAQNKAIALGLFTCNSIVDPALRGQYSDFIIQNI